MSIDPAPEPVALSTKVIPWKRVWLLVGLAGLVSGLTSWGVGEAFHNLFMPPLHSVPVYGGSTQDLATPEDQLKADSRNEIVAFTLLGGILGAFFGLAGGGLQSSKRNAGTSSLFGLLVGILTGAALTGVCLLVYNKYRDIDVNDLIPVLSLHVVVLGGIGAVAGLALGLGIGGRGIAIRAMIGGAVGAIFGGVVADLAGSVLFATDHTHLPVSASVLSRLFYRVVIAVLVAAGVSLAIGDPRRPAQVTA